jgi:hypothetical protein
LAEKGAKHKQAALTSPLLISLRCAFIKQITFSLECGDINSGGGNKKANAKGTAKRAASNDNNKVKYLQSSFARA